MTNDKPHTQALPLSLESPIRLGMMGMTAGNGHPYSWSAIVNGFCLDEFKQLCPFPGIIEYLSKEKETQKISGVQVTHVYCNQLEDAEKVARCAMIPNVVDAPEKMLGQIDALIIATDIGSEHVERARPFVEAGLPLFIDKPLCDNRADLQFFTRLVEQGYPIMSSSSMRYCKELRPYHGNCSELGSLRHVFVPMAKQWETYGIHALEAIYPIMGPGFVSIQSLGEANARVLLLKHRSGCLATIASIYDLRYGGAICLGGTHGHKLLQTSDTYQAFRDQLLDFIGFLRSGIRPYPFSETEELMRLIIGGIESQQQGNIEVLI
ncbi:MAG: Gfo/Idh/MocA family oxidoreductase [Oligosphaeraceae bacterium]|nr:Gfo/Idh/MocA family oxidoreductase [Oligosphaeraceae bacterium]